MKPKVYLETTIPSYLTSRKSENVLVLANQLITDEWWSERRLHYELYISEFVLIEAALGDPAMAKRRLAFLDGISKLETTNQVLELGNDLITEGALPKKAEIDAFHIAVASVHRITYLLTWNCTHLANAAMRTNIETVCKNHKFQPPIICTPFELMED